MNTVVLIGRLTRDPELRHVPSGQPVASFTLAVDRAFTTERGRGTADFIPVVAWRKSAELVSMYLSKGRLVAVEGRLHIRFYKAQDGRRQKAAEVVANRIQFLDRKKGKDVLTVEQPTIDAETDTGAEDAPA
ncbi:MAG: single-stranded DNA-binding protein [Armatimonadetes bacterium 13_1_40CM_64_14]|nr:MAG: single-stranded DNA-binding protein [Armatimonadetes bacterium 13_1_40CM_64_14]